MSARDQVLVNQKGNQLVLCWLYTVPFAIVFKISVQMLLKPV